MSGFFCERNAFYMEKHPFTAGFFSRECVAVCCGALQCVLQRVVGLF